MMKRFQSEAAEMEQKYEQKLTNQYESLTLKHRMEITEVEERKNTQIADLMKNHEDAFTEMKTYYNDITLNNLSLIKSMQVELIVFVCYEVLQIRQDTNLLKKRGIRNISPKIFAIGTNGNDEK